ncbi:MAG: hypothetical protein JNL01_01170 [Bdellovibrionales bacterium]|nr:hypothetical protein [Bdellovibrionales bacterium]
MRLKAPFLMILITSGWVYGLPAAKADKIDLSMGFYSVNFTQNGVHKPGPATLGSVFLNFRKSITPHSELGAGFNAFFLGTVTLAPGTGFEVSYTYYPFSAAEAIEWKETNVRMSIRELWRPFVTAIALQRNYPSSGTTQNFSFFGGGAAVGTERTLKGELSIRAEAGFGMGAGAGAVKSTFMDIKGGLSYRF